MGQAEHVWHPLVWGRPLWLLCQLIPPSQLWVPLMQSELGSQRWVKPELRRSLSIISPLGRISCSPFCHFLWAPSSVFGGVWKKWRAGQWEACLAFLFHPVLALCKDSQIPMPKVLSWASFLLAYPPWVASTGEGLPGGMGKRHLHFLQGEMEISSPWGRCCCQLYWPCPPGGAAFGEEPQRGWWVFPRRRVLV